MCAYRQLRVFAYVEYFDVFSGQVTPDQKVYLRPKTKENDVTVTYSDGIESRRARDSNAIVIVGRLRHVLALQHSAWNKRNCQSLVHEVG